MDKSPEAFRTISEVAEALETPAHVLRFWESRFPQIRPVKRAGGRRYYRPSDVALLAGIKRLLHDEGMTIRGVQKILREQGIRHVSGLVDEEGTAEEAALGAALGSVLAEETAGPADEAARATAEALEAALDPASVVVPLYPTAPAAAATEAPGEVPGDDQDDQEAMLRRLAETDGPAEEAPGGQPEAAATAPDTTAPEAAPATPATAEQVAGDTVPASAPVPVAEPAPALPRLLQEAPETAPASATLAARLRALPRGSLSARREELVTLAARFGALRDRLAAPPSARG